MVHFRQMNVYYAICQALKYHSNNLPGAITYYDVSCGWIVHFLDRVMEGEYLELPEGMEDIIDWRPKSKLSAAKLIH